MLSKETKKKIDDARDILVGQLPLPSDQVELITIALIYKFMDDQDEDLRQLGFQEAFFTDDLKQYSWQRLMSNEIDAEERVQTFIKGIEEVQKAAHIPQLFRDIFKNTFLKFRDGRTLHLFLGVINGFRYDHSEELGNAFEYLLMSMGAQGENGQFRTPRNIIDFIVEVVDPDKGDTILDPACGTGGFLLSAFKHVLRKHTSGMEHYRITLNNEDIEGIPVNWGDRLTTQDLQRLGESIEGYDITPLMTRLARVNLFLHQFKSPRIHEYDTLTSDGRWKDKYDCILANPPFMTPKGGVSTHSKFRIRATKAEVLFSDYILEHLAPDGKAGFIVPEGIIFQNSGDYTELRKWLVEAAGLWAVVSLPAQVFQPYSGVKTSILFIDRELARTRDEIILVKVENDGYSLNTNRNKIGKNDLPEALQMLTIGKKSLSELREYLGENGGKANVPKVLIRPRSEFARLDAYKAQTTAFNVVRKQFEKCKALEEEIKANPSPAALTPPGLPLTGEEKQGRSPSSPLTRGDRGGLKNARLQTAFAKQAAEFYKVADFRYEKINPSVQNFFDTRLKDAVIAFGADRTQTAGLPLPLREHLDGEREYNLSFDSTVERGTRVVGGDGWEKRTLREICEVITDGTHFKPMYSESGFKFLSAKNVVSKRIDWENVKYVDEVQHNELKRRVSPRKFDVLLAKNGTTGVAAINETDEEFDIYVSLALLRPSNSVYPYFLLHLLNSDLVKQQFNGRLKGVGVPNLHLQEIKQVAIPIPPLEVQKQIVAEIEGYQKVIDGCNLIIENYKACFDINADWPEVKLHSICETITDGDHMPPPKTDEGVPFITISNIKAGCGIDFSSTYYVSEEYYAGLKEHRKPKKGDILYTVTGSFGIPVLIDFDKQFCFQRHIGLIRPATTVNSKFLYLYLQSPTAFEQAVKTATGVAQKTVALSSLRNFSIPLPPLEIQQKIVADLEEDLAAVAGARRLKAKMEAKIKAVIDHVWGGKG